MDENSACGTINQLEDKVALTVAMVSHRDDQVLAEDIVRYSMLLTNRSSKTQSPSPITVSFVSLFQTHGFLIGSIPGKHRLANCHVYLFKGKRIMELLLLVFW